MRLKYCKKSDQFIVAVQLNLNTQGFIYEKWGSYQRCKQNDWVVNNNGDIYTIDKEVFSKTYKKVQDGIYVKTGYVYAEVTKESGTVETREGRSHYKKGDYLLFNSEDGTDTYCVSAKKFESMYERVEAIND